MKIGKLSPRKIVFTAVFCALLALLLAAAAFAEDYGSFSYSITEPEGEEDFEPYITITNYRRDDTEASPVVLIPAEIDGKPVTAIAPGAFDRDDVSEEFIIPAGVTEIGNAAFADCTAMKAVIIPDSVKMIGCSAFQNCSSLEYAVLGSGTETVGALAFKGCTALSALDLGGAKLIESGAFYNCPSLKNIAVPASVGEIESLALGFEDGTDGATPVEGVTFYTYDGPLAALREYIAASGASDGEPASGDGAASVFPARIVEECDKHSLEWKRIRVASSVYEGVELAQCARCFDISSRTDNDVPPEEKNTSGLIILIITVAAVAVFAVLVIRYVKSSKTRREKAKAEFSAGSGGDKEKEEGK